MPTRSYYAITPPRRSWWRRLLRTGSPAAAERDYTGWTARATSIRDVPAGTAGVVVGSKRRSDGLVHVIDFPGLTLHVPLPWPGIELVKGRAVLRSRPGSH